MTSGAVEMRLEPGQGQQFLENALPARLHQRQAMSGHSEKVIVWKLDMGSH